MPKDLRVFDQQYKFKGKHALEVDALTTPFEKTGKAKFFERNVDVYTMAPLVGFLYQRRADEDKTKDPVTNQEYTESIFIDQARNSAVEMLFNFQLIMLLDENYEKDVHNRINKAFRFKDESIAKDIEWFFCYVRGGVDVLYEKLLSDNTPSSNNMEKLYDFLEEIEDRYNKNISMQKLIEMLDGSSNKNYE